MPFQAVVDGRALPAHPMDPVASPPGVGVPVLVSSTRDDMKMMMLAMPWFGALDDAGLDAMADSMFGAAGPEVARTISEAFVHFAQEGNPSHASMPAGSPYSLGERAPMVFNATSWAENDPRPLYPEICARS